MTSLNKWDTSKFEAILNRLEGLCKKEVEWGFFEDSVYPANHPNPAAAGLPVATVAYGNEYGNHLAPSRPFFTLHIKEIFPAFSGNASRAPLIAPQLTNIVQNAISNRGTGAAYRRLGAALQDGLREQIENYGLNGEAFPSNSQKWQAVKGFDDPLRQSGKMIESVDYRVATAGGA